MEFSMSGHDMLRALLVILIVVWGGLPGISNLWGMKALGIFIGVIALAAIITIIWSAL